MFISIPYLVVHKASDKMQSLETHDKIWACCRQIFKCFRKLFDDYLPSRLKAEENRLILCSMKQISSLRKNAFRRCRNSLFTRIAEILVDKTNYHLYIPRHCYSVPSFRAGFDESCLLFAVSLQVRKTAGRLWNEILSRHERLCFLVRLIPCSGSLMTVTQITAQQVGKPMTNCLHPPSEDFLLSVLYIWICTL